MKHLPSRLFLIMAPIALGLAVWGTFKITARQSNATHVVATTEPEPGYAAHNARIVETGADGKPMYSLQAVTIQQDPDNNNIDLTQVHMTFRDAYGGVWNATADQGRARPDSSRIDLKGNVDVRGSFAGVSQPAHFITDTLDIDTRADVIHTAAPVALDWNGNIVHARGLSASLKEHHVRLEADVHGQFKR
jgi:LPS export ABC transporter protein LptC